jgi:4-hydroxymandelate synthase
MTSEMGSMTTERAPFDDMRVDHIGLYVEDLAAARSWLVDGYGFSVYAQSRSSTAESVGLGTDQIRLVLTRPGADGHPGAAYVARHGDGVADIALGVPDAAAAFEVAVGRGAHPVTEPVSRDGVVTATVLGFGDVVHTFVERAPSVDERRLPGLSPLGAAGSSASLSTVDHFAICVEAGQLDGTIEFYQRVFDFEMVFTERIVVGSQAMDSKVVQSRSGAVTLTVIEPDTSLASGQIDDFLRAHRGPGVQHVAFTTDDIVHAVGDIDARGVAFLGTPASYYQQLPNRLTPMRHPVEDLRRLNILVDEDHDGQLFQIFSRSVHPRNTFFVEVIERMGARTFGSGNIKALYEAVEAQRGTGEAAAA